MSELLQLPATISKATTMAHKVLRLQVDTNENLTKEQMAKIMQNVEEFGYFCFLVGEEKIDEKLIAELPELPKDDSARKTPSQQFRDRLFVYYMSTHTDKNKFNAWYQDALDKLGNQYLQKMDAPIE